jgi:hypothetical protein
LYEKKAIDERIQFQLTSLYSYPNWPKEMCNVLVDSSMINSLEASGLLAVKVTNKDYDLFMIDLSEELLCDTLNLYTPACAKLRSPKPNARWRDVSTS